MKTVSVLQYCVLFNQSINQTRQFLTRRNTAKPLQGRKNVIIIMHYYNYNHCYNGAQKYEQFLQVG